VDDPHLDPHIESAQRAMEREVCGDYERVYPSDDDDRHLVYEELIEKARTEFFGRGMRRSRSSASMTGPTHVKVDVPDTLDLPMRPYFDWDRNLQDTTQPTPPYVRNPEMMSRAIMAKLQAIMFTHDSLDMVQMDQLQADMFPDVLRAFWFAKLTPDSRMALVTFVMKTVKLKALDSVPNKARIFNILTQTFKRLTRNRCSDLVNTFEIPPFEWDTLNMVLNVGTCTPTEQQCCLNVVKLCRDALTVAYLTVNAGEQEQEQGGKVLPSIGKAASSV